MERQDKGMGWESPTEEPRGMKEKNDTRSCLKRDIIWEEVMSIMSSGR